MKPGSQERGQAWSSSRFAYPRSRTDSSLRKVYSGLDELLLRLLLVGEIAHKVPSRFLFLGSMRGFLRRKQANNSILPVFGTNTGELCAIRVSAGRALQV